MSFQNPAPVPIPEPLPLSQGELGRIRLSFIRRTYALFLLGLLVTGVGAMLTIGNRALLMLVLDHLMIAFLLQLGLILAGGFLRDRTPWNALFYFAFTFLSGVILGPIVLLYTNESGSFDIVIQAFVLTTSIFIGLSLFVFVSRKDFSFLRGGLVIALFTLLGLAVLNIFLRTEALDLFVASLGAVLFSGFILYDTSRLLHAAGQMSPISAALALYLDFYNLFLSLLRLLGRRR